ncbi:MAG: type II secretion system protein [Candidatus Pacebacteria bacterium]|jgi:prepilin-type N-terminal cleavage/methylation domain-containing protein|nr:type II secretion system protein [Candidatus Paceibacterota bacterium]
MKINFFKKLHSTQQGFTLVETLVAISIFTLSILSLMVILTKSIADTNYAKKKLVAGYLAQEGIEYIRNMRDTYVVSSATGQIGWDAFNALLVSSACNTASGCYFNDAFSDYSTAVVACSNQGCPEILYESGQGRYGYTGSNSGYVRKITATISTNQTKIFSTVTWVQNSGTYSTTLAETVFNWAD